MRVSVATGGGVMSDFFSDFMGDFIEKHQTDPKPIEDMTTEECIRHMERKIKETENGMG
jgi:hypothetical protein